MSGLHSAQQAMRRGVYGSNEIVVPVKGFFTLLVLEILNPFYVFQLLSFGLWMYDNYYYYAMVILGMTSCGVFMAVLQTRRVSHSNNNINHKFSLIHFYFVLVIIMLC